MNLLIISVGLGRYPLKMKLLCSWGRETKSLSIKRKDFFMIIHGYLARMIGKVYRIRLWQVEAMLKPPTPAGIDFVRAVFRAREEVFAEIFLSLKNLVDEFLRD